jgi:hypothetical protein
VVKLSIFGADINEKEVWPNGKRISIEMEHIKHITFDN